MSILSPIHIPFLRITLFEEAVIQLCHLLYSQVERLSGITLWY